MTMRRALVKELAPLRRNAIEDHPWREWAGAAAESSRMPGAQSRWSAGKDLSWEPLRAERVCEVKYDHMQGDRFRHAALFLRWRRTSRRAVPLRPARGHQALRARKDLLVRVERLLRRPQRLGHVLQVHRMRVQVL